MYTRFSALFLTLLTACAGSLLTGSTGPSSEEEESNAATNPQAQAAPRASDDELSILTKISELEQRLSDAKNRGPMPLAWTQSYLDGGAASRSYLDDFWKLSEQSETFRADIEQRLAAVVASFHKWHAEKAASSEVPRSATTDRAVEAAVTEKAASDFAALKISYEVTGVSVLDKAWNLSMSEVGTVNGRFKRAQALLRSSAEPTVCFKVGARAFQVGDGSHWEKTMNATLDADAFPAACAP